MDDPITRLPRECLALIHELFTKEVVDEREAFARQAGDRIVHVSLCAGG